MAGTDDSMHDGEERPTKRRRRVQVEADADLFEERKPVDPSTLAPIFRPHAASEPQKPTRKQSRKQPQKQSDKQPPQNKQKQPQKRSDKPAPQKKPPRQQTHPPADGEGEQQRGKTDADAAPTDRDASKHDDAVRDRPSSETKRRRSRPSDAPAAAPAAAAEPEPEPAVKLPPAPAAPKKPATAYFLFTNDRRPALMAETGAKMTAVAKMLGVEWRGLTAEQKAVYETRQAADKERYSAELKAHEEAMAAYRTEVAALTGGEQGSGTPLPAGRVWEHSLAKLLLGTPYSWQLKGHQTVAAVARPRHSAGAAAPGPEAERAEVEEDAPAVAEEEEDIEQEGEVLVFADEEDAGDEEMLPAQT